MGRARCRASSTINHACCAGVVRVLSATVIRYSNSHSRKRSKKTSRAYTSMFRSFFSRRGLHFLRRYRALIRVRVICRVFRVSCLGLLIERAFCFSGRWRKDRYDWSRVSRCVPRKKVSRGPVSKEFVVKALGTLLKGLTLTGGASI